MRHRIIWLGLLLLLLAGSVSPRAAQAGLWFTQTGVLNKNITLCFVGNAISQRPDRVAEVLDYIKHFEYAANIHFLTLAGKPVREELTNNPNALVCPAPTKQRNGDDSFAGDIRVALSKTNADLTPPGMVPGDGCIQEKVNSDFGNGPDELVEKRACQYNLKLSDAGDTNGKPWLNHTLHEFGHALGLKHEHARADENANCVPSNHKDYHVVNGGYMTPYDVDSVMHYWWPQEDVPNCKQIGSNYSHSGLTDYDRLTLHILYPEDNRLAEFVGATVIRTTETLALHSAWKVRGANLAYVAKEFVWKLNGTPVSTTPELIVNGLSAGDYTLQFSHKDLLGRQYTYAGTVRVLKPEEYDRLIAASVAAANEVLFTSGPVHSYTVSNAGETLNLTQNVSLAIQAGDFDGPATVQYARLPLMATQTLADIGFFYELSAVDPITGEPLEVVAGQSYDIALTYAQENIPRGLDESRLGLYAWDGRQWVREASSHVDPEMNQVMASPNHFSQWAILAETTTMQAIYLPFVTNQ